MATVEVIRPSPSSELLRSVESRSGQSVLACNQCGKCSAGCPVAYVMDLTPRQVMRAVQLGLEDEVLRSSSIWLCLFCETCALRCPQEIDIPKVMESLRQLAITEKSKPAEREVSLSHRLFLQIVRRWGRIYETGLAVGQNLWSGHLFANIALLPAMLSKGKLPLRPPRNQGVAEVRDIFRRAAEAEARIRESAGPE